MNIWIHFLLFTTVYCQISTDKQTSCFKQIPIYRSNSPYQIKNQGDQICINHDKYNDLEKSISQQLNTSTLARSINLDNSISLPSSTPINLTTYQAGTSVFKYLNSTKRAFYFTLPVSFFNDRTCSGSHPITYMNDFTSTCVQTVSSSTCSVALNPNTYANELYLVTNPRSLAEATPSIVLCSGTSSGASWTTPNCLNALQTFELNIYYSNPDGIAGCNFTINRNTASIGTTFAQTFTVRFLKTGTVASTQTRSGNPGYLPGSLIKTATVNGNSYTPTSGLAVLQVGSGNALCTVSSTRFIRFGENLESTCLYSGCLNTTDFTNFLGLSSLANLSVSMYGNPDATSNQWLRPTFCTSTIGSTESATCSHGSIPALPANQCFTRVDIQIIYANLGSVTNPQSILASVIYYFQSSSTITSANQILVTQTVTFEEMSSSPATQGDLIPRPNTRLPGDFFYPFSLNHSSRMTLISSIFYLVLFLVLLF